MTKIIDYIKYRIFCNKVFKQCKQEYPWANNLKLHIPMFNKKYSGQYFPHNRLVKINIHEVVKETQWSNHNSVKAFTPKERLVKTILHELRHCYQEDKGIFNVYDNSSSFGLSQLQYMQLPYEKDANRFARREWNRLWRKRI